MHNSGEEFLPPQIRMRAEGAAGPINQDALPVPTITGATTCKMIQL